MGLLTISAGPQFRRIIAPVAGSLVRPVALSATLILLTLVPATANATEPDNTQLPISGSLEAWDASARQLMSQGQFDEASAIINARLAMVPKDVQARFLKGMIALAKGENREAIRMFRSILVDQPGAARVRLELARAFYLDKDYGNALRQFQLALAAHHPPEVAANIARYIALIRQAKTVSYHFDVAVAPDTNLNTGSSAREVSLFGLPFDLSDDARKRSGVGLALAAGGEWAPQIGKSTRLRLGFEGQRRDYAGSTFDDTILAVHMGPRVSSGRWDASVLATASQRWFGPAVYNHAAGASLEATYFVSPRFELSVALVSQWVQYRRDSTRNVRVIALNVGAFTALSSSSVVTAKVGVSRQDAKFSAYSNWSGFVAVGYFRELPMGFSAYVEPSISFAHYDTALLGFDRRRVDKTKSVLVTLLNRRLVLGRFTPRLSYTYVVQSSSVPLYAFTRNRLEVGLTTTF